MPLFVPDPNNAGKREMRTKQHPIRWGGCIKMAATPPFTAKMSALLVPQSISPFTAKANALLLSPSRSPFTAKVNALATSSFNYNSIHCSIKCTTSSLVALSIIPFAAQLSTLATSSSNYKSIHCSTK